MSFASSDTVICCLVPSGCCCSADSFFYKPPEFKASCLTALLSLTCWGRFSLKTHELLLSVFLHSLQILTRRNLQWTSCHPTHHPTRRPPLLRADMCTHGCVLNHRHRKCIFLHQLPTVQCVNVQEANCKRLCKIHHSIITVSDTETTTGCSMRLTNII